MLQLYFYLAFNAICFPFVYLYQFILTLVPAPQTALHFLPDFVLPAASLVGLVLLVSKSLFFAQIYVQPFLKRHINKACTRFGFPHQRCKSLPFALIAGLTLGTVLCLTALVYYAKEVTDLMEFVQEGRPARNPHFRSYFCRERGGNGTPILVHGWSYRLWLYYDGCYRVDDMFDSIRAQSVAYSKTCDHYAWRDRATCAAEFIKNGFVEQSHESYRSSISVISTLGKDAGNWLLSNALDVAVYATGLIVMKAAFDMHRAMHKPHTYLPSQREQVSHRSIPREGKTKNGTTTLEWLLFILSFLSAFYATAMAFLAPVIATILPSIVTYLPVIYDMPDLSFRYYLSPDYDVDNLRYQLLSRVSLFLNFVWHGDASNYRKSEYWECKDWWGNVVKVFAPMAEATKAGFVKCVHVRPRADEFIEMCDMDGRMARARCIIWNSMKGTFANPLNVNAIAIDKIRSCLTSTVHFFGSLTRDAFGHKFFSSVLIILAICLHIIPKPDGDAQIKYERELIEHRSLLARREVLLDRLHRLREWAREQNIEVRPDTEHTPNSTIPARQTHTGEIVGLGLNTEPGSETKIVPPADRDIVLVKRRRIDREIEGRAILAKLRAMEREKEACESDSDVDSDATVEAITPRDDAFVASKTVKKQLSDATV